MIICFVTYYVDVSYITEMTGGIKPR